MEENIGKGANKRITEIQKGGIVITTENFFPEKRSVFSDKENCVIEEVRVNPDGFYNIKIRESDLIISENGSFKTILDRSGKIQITNKKDVYVINISTNSGLGLVYGDKLANNPKIIWIPIPSAYDSEGNLNLSEDIKEQFKSVLEKIDKGAYDIIIGEAKELKLRQANAGRPASGGQPAGGARNNGGNELEEI